MRPTNEFSLGEAIRMYLEQLRLNDRFDLEQLKEKWPGIVGQAIANRTLKLQIREKTLFIWLTSSVVKEEMSYNQEKIIRMVNEALKTNLIDQIVIR